MTSPFSDKAPKPKPLAIEQARQLYLDALAKLPNSTREVEAFNQAVEELPDDPAITEELKTMERQFTDKVGRGEIIFDVVFPSRTSRSPRKVRHEYETRTQEDEAE